MGVTDHLDGKEFEIETNKRSILRFLRPELKPWTTKNMVFDSIIKDSGFERRDFLINHGEGWYKLARPLIKSGRTYFQTMVGGLKTAGYQKGDNASRDKARYLRPRISGQDDSRVWVMAYGSADGNKLDLPTCTQRNCKCTGECGTATEGPFAAYERLRKSKYTTEIMRCNLPTGGSTKTLDEILGYNLKNGGTRRGQGYGGNGHQLLKDEFDELGSL